MPSRILIFGGTFDPPHLAHSRLPPLVAERLECGRIIYIPAAVSPLKSGEPAAPAEHRLAMLHLALADVPDAEISTIELYRPGPSYTVDTLEALREELGSGHELHLLVGSDQALLFHQWKRWRRVIELATPAVMLRPPLDEASYRGRLQATYPSQEVDRWLLWRVSVPRMDVCATTIRRLLAEGKDVTGMMDSRVLEYIRRHGLYRPSR